MVKVAVGWTCCLVPNEMLYVHLDHGRPMLLNLPAKLNFRSAMSDLGMQRGLLNSRNSFLQHGEYMWMTRSDT